jgi:L-fuconolactonase
MRPFASRLGRRPDVVAGVGLLRVCDFSCDPCSRHGQLPAVTFVLDHLDKPAIWEGRLDPWQDHLAAFAAVPNVACKLSGVATEADWQHWHREHLVRAVAHTLQ